MSANTTLPEDKDRLPTNRATDPDTWFAEKFVRFLQIIFSKREPGDYHWSQDESETEILLTDQVPLPLNAIEQRPAVQLVVATSANQNLGFDHLVSLDLRTGKRVHADMFSGQASFNVHARSDTVCRRLAKYIQYQIMQERRYLIRLAKLHHVGTQVQMGPSSPPGALVSAGSSVESIIVPVMFPFFYSEWWESSPKMIPLGDADPEAGGLSPYIDKKLKTPGAIKQINIDARMLRPGVTFRREEGLRQVRSAPLSPPTFRGRVMEVVRRLDEEITDDDLSSHVTIAAVADDNEE